MLSESHVKYIMYASQESHAHTFSCAMHASQEPHACAMHASHKPKMRPHTSDSLMRLFEQNLLKKIGYLNFS
jgi:hypothetical protein